MSDNPTTRDSIIKQAQNVPQLVSAAERFDPALAESLTPKALWASKSAPGTLLVAVITYLVSKYGLGWDGGTVDLVSGAAVLIGDLLLSWADEVLFTSGLPERDVLRAKPLYDLMRTELMAGQYLDLLEQASGDGSEDRVMRVARYKTAKYTVERPLHVGGALAGATAEVMAAYSGYGLPLGEAFQLRDDVLGVFGDPAVTGKPAGDDLREGKRTLLIHATLHTATAPQRATLEAGLGNRELQDSEVQQLRDIIIDSGGLLVVEDRIASLRTEALDALHDVELDPEAVQVLHDIAVAATSREA